MKAPLPEGAIVATVVSGAMIAQQVAGKAARDALFLSSFRVTALPWMMVGSAALSLLAALWLSRMIVVYSPRAVVPMSFAASAAGLFGEWALSFSAPRVAAVVVYFHTALFGAAVISAFWSLINERFDAHAGKRAVAFVTGGGTLGGVLGGLLAWRASAVVEVPTMLPMLGAINLVCLWGCLRLRNQERGAPEGAPSREAPKKEPAGSTAASDPFTAFHMLREGPYLRNLSMVVVLGAITSGLLDYVFSAEAVLRYAKGPQLLAFFSLFWLVVGILSFALQMLLGRLALEKLGLAITLALLPGVVILGGAFGLAIPGLWSMSLLRGGEATQRNSLFREAYELLYTPLSANKKRATKMLIDVGFDRLGTIVAGGIIVLAVGVDAARANGALMVAAVGCAIVTLTRSRPLHTGYATVLKEGLYNEAEKMDAGSGNDLEHRPRPEGAEIRDELVTQLETRPEVPSVVLEVLKGRPLAASVPIEASLDRARDLCSKDALRVRAALAANTPLERPLVPFAISLLASKVFHLDAIRALKEVASHHAGQLVDALCDAGTPLDIRRRIPRALAFCATRVAVEGLVSGTEDDHFVVRYECGRALLRLTKDAPALAISMETIIQIITREVSVSEKTRESQPPPELDEWDDEPNALIGRLLVDRADRTLEHLFTILALNLDRESISLAFKALHQNDTRLRGTALEYLETVLPDAVRESIWPLLHEERPMHPLRAAEDILADLVEHDAEAARRTASATSTPTRPRSPPGGH